MLVLRDLAQALPPVRPGERGTRGGSEAATFSSRSMWRSFASKAKVF